MTDESVSLAYCICSGEISKDNLEEDEDIEDIVPAMGSSEDIAAAEEFASEVESETPEIIEWEE